MNLTRKRDRLSVNKDFATVMRVGAAEQRLSLVKFSEKVMEEPELLRDLINDRKKKRSIFP